MFTDPFYIAEMNFSKDILELKTKQNMCMYMCFFSSINNPIQGLLTPYKGCAGLIWIVASVDKLMTTL